MANKISVVIDVAVDRANQALGGFRKSVSDADGAVGKFKAGAGAALDSVKANAANLALAGGAAIVAFAAKGVDEFNKLAIESGKMSDALGIPVEEMSRLIEVAGDLGIETTALESTIGRMNRTASSTPKYFEDINAEIVKNADGTTNVNETFLATVDALNRIPDATKRAEAAQRIFGRSWQDIAELVGQGADDIRVSLAEVSDQKIINESEVEDARKYRAAMDALNDAIQDISLAAGQVLTPILAKAAEVIADLTSGVEDANDATGGYLGKLGDLAQANYKYLNPVGQVITAHDMLTGATKETTGSIGDLSGATDDAAESFEWVTDATDLASRSAERNKQKIKDLEDQYRSLRDELSDRSAYLDLQDSFDAVLAKGMEAFNGTEESARAYERAQIDLKNGVLDYIEEVGNIPTDVMTDVQALIDEEKYDEAERRLALFEKIRIARITPETYMPSTKISGYRASGGPVSAGGAYVVGEDGPELLQMGSQSGNVIPNGATIGGGSTTVNVTVNGADPNMVIAAIRKYVRTNGPVTGIT